VSTTTQSVSLLAQLREATRAPHAELDRTLLPEPEALHMSRLQALLLGSFAVLDSLEPRLRAFFPGATERTRTACLLSDLAALGVRPLPIAITVPEPSNIAEAYGCAYVVEGSSLGAMMIAQQARHTLGLRSESLHYLGFHGSDTRHHFARFCERLERWAATAGAAERERACSAAKATFAAYAAALRQAIALVEPGVGAAELA
jgi:heme oxygenase